MSNENSPTFLDTRELAARHRKTPQAIRAARVTGGGPPFVKIGGAVRYRLSDIEAYEARNTFTSTAAEQPTAAESARP